MDETCSTNRKGNKCKEGLYVGRLRKETAVQKGVDGKTILKLVLIK